MVHPSTLATLVRCAALVTVAALACGDTSSTPPASPPVAPPVSQPGAPAVTAFDPDVPAWRGGCFTAGPPGKIVNGTPSADVRLFGRACEAVPGPGGLVYLDRYDPVAGTGDVTVLSSDPGARPLVVAPQGGAGGTVNGGAGVRFDAAPAQASRLLTLARLDVVRGDLVLVDLPSGPARTLAANVRVENYDFLPGGGALFVGNYDPDARTGDLSLWDGAAVRVLARGASRFDFLMYRLAPDRSRVGYLLGWTASGGGDLFVQPLPAAALVTAPLDTRVADMSWTADGQRLVYLKANASGVTFALNVWDGTSVRVVDPAVDATQVVGDTIVYATGWDVIAQQAILHAVPAAGVGVDVLGGATPAALAFGAAQRGALGAVAWVANSVQDPLSGVPFAAPLPDGPRRQVETAGGVSAAAAFDFGPLGTHFTYARDFRAPQSPGSANAQPGVAGALLVAPVAGGAPFVLARDASVQWIGWDPAERFVAGLGAFRPAANAGQLVVWDVAAGAQVFAEPMDVGGVWFDFGDDGASMALIRGWDDALQRGELVLVPTATWSPVAVDRSVTFYLRPVGGRVLYGVRGGGRDGLWLGGAP